MANINSLVNNNFKLLVYLYDRKDTENLIKTTQAEISEDLQLNRGTVNLIFKNLKENGYLLQDKSRIGRYYLTNDAVKIVETFRKFNK